jgi:prepilin-type N-terminal cleavage/methylation domain-containing protein
MSERPVDRRRASRGFTLIEVMLTLVILAFGMLTLAIMQLQALRQGAQGRHTGDGTAIARSYLEQASRVPWSELDVAQAAGTWVAPAWAGLPAAQVTVDRPDSLAASTEHSYTILWRVTDVGGPPVCLRDVEVSVTWTEKGSTTPKTHVLGTRRYNEGNASC